MSNTTTQSTLIITITIPVIINQVLNYSDEDCDIIDFFDCAFKGYHDENPYLRYWVADRMVEYKIDLLEDFEIICTQRQAKLKKTNPKLAFRYTQFKLYITSLINEIENIDSF